VPRDLPATGPAQPLSARGLALPTAPQSPPGVHEGEERLAALPPHAPLDSTHCCWLCSGLCGIKIPITYSYHFPITFLSLFLSLTSLNASRPNYGRQIGPNDARSISARAAEYRKRLGVDSSDTNIAVIRYADKSGRIRYSYGRASRFKLHAEKQAFAKLPRYARQDPTRYIKQLYTELSPCPGCANSMGGVGRSNIMMNIPESKVRWSFDRLADRTAFEEYVASLFT